MNSDSLNMVSRLGEGHMPCNFFLSEPQLKTTVINIGYTKLGSFLPKSKPGLKDFFVFFEMEECISKPVSITPFQKIQKIISTWSLLGKNYSNFQYPQINQYSTSEVMLMRTVILAQISYLQIKDMLSFGPLIRYE